MRPNLENKRLKYSVEIRQKNRNEMFENNRLKHIDTK